MADFATWQDLQAIWRPLSVDEQARATKLLGYASAFIRNEFAGIDARIAAHDDDPRPNEAIDPEMVEYVALRMVKRAMPGDDGSDNVSSEMLVAGPFTRQRSFATPLGELYLTRREYGMLAPGGSRPRAFTINPLAAGAGEDLPWWDREPRS
ncbi:hypothetical protein IU433_12245 [Nocardia puris]|uniref:Gp19/Gp15/Gp42 family protein n=1 Tax=Nocardia puris TaxID=208602 RepID=UPI0018956195|nr:Gp19/Gp15/Gp42 family protein [Nocardia puris]MBF6459807.1 hypothetical protein [Nocardia puris]